MNKGANMLILKTVNGAIFLQSDDGISDEVYKLTLDQPVYLNGFIAQNTNGFNLSSPELKTIYLGIASKIADRIYYDVSIGKFIGEPLDLLGKLATVLTEIVNERLSVEIDTTLLKKYIYGLLKLRFSCILDEAKGELTSLALVDENFLDAYLPADVVEYAENNKELFKKARNLTVLKSK
jgi:hypothetical protein